ncbi:hypothetical protein FACS189479_04740 [Spirochaetia bacterium]|nr:hypothetical protein FACS189479_04740 [Spirochaetia bacterium]
MRPVLILILILAAMFSSCKSAPQPSAAATVEHEVSPEIQNEAPPPEAIPPAAEIFTNDEPSVAALPEEPADTDLPENLLEPQADFAEAALLKIPPAEDAFSAVLPEPAVPVLDFPLKPEPPMAELPDAVSTEAAVEALAQAAPETPPEPVAAPPVPSLAPTPPPTPPAPVPAAPTPPLAEPDPEPPAAPPLALFPEPAELPAEEETPPALTREPVPMPVRPIPEAPAAISPLTGEDEGIVFSRIVRAAVGQLVEIPFQGTGWVYLGELGARRGINYDSRRLDTEGQSFVFRAEAAGTYALKFYKQDFVRDYILNDHVQVIIGEAPAISVTGYFNPPLDRGRVIAEPRWPTAAEEAEAFRRGGNAPSSVPAAAAVSGLVPTNEPESSVPAADAAASQSAIPTISAAEGQAAQTNQQALSPAPPVQNAAPPQRLEPDQYLTQAREEFDAGRVAAALSMLDQFREHYPSGSDEAYWLYGQFYEANSPSRDIRLSLDYYRRLVRDYPQSSRYNDARQRIAYLERYYINIR